MLAHRASAIYLELRTQGDADRDLLQVAVRDHIRVQLLLHAE